MHPIGFIKAHPVATVTLLATGMMAGPWLLNTIGAKTGVNISLPTAGSSKG
jgi:hypothetical protein